MTTIRSARNGDPVDLDAAYIPPWGNPGYVENSTKPKRECDRCGYRYGSSMGCPLCGEDE